MNICTITLNPSIDYHISIEQFLEGESSSSQNNSFFAGGKGLNVSHVLHNLHCPSKAFAFIGGFTGKFITEHSQNFIYPIPIKGVNRINTKIKTAYSETEIHGVAPTIQKEEFTHLCKKISQQQISTLILSGSIPSSLTQDTYKILASYCSPQTKIVVDTRGEALKECLHLNNIFLLKPNKDELGELFNIKINSNNMALDYAKKLKNTYSIEHLIVSLGAEGAYFLHNNDIYFAEPLKGTLISSVGSGDSLVAGFVAKYHQTRDPIKSFKYGIACGAGTAFSHGLCDKNTADLLFQQIIVTKI